MVRAVDVVRSFYDALGWGDLPIILTLLDAEVAWTEAERFPYYGGTWRGPQAVVEGLFEPLARDWSAFTATPERFVTQGEQVVAFGAYAGTHRRTGRSFTAPFAHLWTVRAGKAVGFVQYTDTAKILQVVQA